MKVTVDTNILVRAVVRDDEKQGDSAATLLGEAEIVAVPLAALCEFVWVLRQVYGMNRDDIADALEILLSSDNVAVDRSAADAGLAILGAGGDFADGVIAYDGRRLGGETLMSFDKKAVGLIAAQGHKAKLLA